MFHEIYQLLPLHINPIAFSIGFFSIRWYGLSYLAGFIAVWLLLSYEIKKSELNYVFKISNKNSEKLKQNILLDWLLASFFAALVGGRLGYALFYNASYFIANPLAIISPYDIQSGKFVGIFGMSYHGALVAIIVASYIFLKKKNINFLVWADFVVPAVALGYFFGRVGNFLNGELYGRITNSLFGMYFSADILNLRHPSQLYEAFLEGLLLFVILWNTRNNKMKSGFLFGIYLVGYATFRILIEQVREPDVQIGFLWNYFTMGQILSSLMLLSGLFFIVSKNEK
jgi:phosphatidylglycerol:prolipoprotein diacylglycerol transferase